MKRLAALSVITALVLASCATQVIVETEIIVAPNKVICGTNKDLECNLIKQLYNGNFSSYSVLGVPIEGFDYKPGIRYHLSVTQYGYLPGVVETNLRHYYKLKQVIEAVPDSKVYYEGQY
ncbi:DUF4377 domain-containing protein [Deinococcus puniceus]|uniref:DUF4377 domain-containing protein n=1 Tax=Deinococcus puniceus TaxID=1182568 RepID=UPI0009EE2B7B|nr:DUF4377 domain-containing protein [Deinococcus puniceus]